MEAVLIWNTCELLQCKWSDQFSPVMITDMVTVFFANLHWDQWNKFLVLT